LLFGYPPLDPQETVLFQQARFFTPFWRWMSNGKALIRE